MSYEQPKLNKLNSLKQLDEYASSKDNNINSLEKIDKEITTKLDTITPENIKRIIKEVSENSDDERINSTLVKLENITEALSKADNKKDKEDSNGRATALLSQLQQQLVTLKKDYDSSVKTISGSEYLSKGNKKVLKDALYKSTSKEEIDKIAKISTEEATNAEFLVKVLSNVKKNIEDNKKELTESGKNTETLINKVFAITDLYHKTGKVDLSSMSSLINEVSSVKDKEGNQIITLDPKAMEAISSAQEKQLNLFISKTIDTTVRDYQSTLSKSDKSKSQVATNKFDRGEISSKEYIQELKALGINTDKLSKAIDELTKASKLKENIVTDQLKEFTDKLSEKDKSHFSELTKLYTDGNSATSEYFNSLEKLFSDSNNTTTEEKQLIVAKLGNLETTMTDIDKHTDTKTNKVSNAEKISEINRQETETENQKAFRSAVDGLKNIEEDKQVKSSVISGSKDAEELGENTTNAVIDKASDWLGPKITKLLGKSKIGKAIGSFLGKSKIGKTIGGISKLLGIGGAEGGGGLLGGAESLLGLGGETAEASTIGTTAVTTATEAGSGLASGAGSLLSGAAKFAGPAAAIASTALSGFHYLTAKDSKDRKKAAGSGIGGLIGGALGSLIPIPGVGTALGAMAGNYIGGMVGGWFADIEDNIPDKVKEDGPIQELNFIDNSLMPKVQQEAMKPDGKFDVDDVKDLRKYRAKVVKKLPKYLNKMISVAGLGKGSPKKKEDYLNHKLESLKQYPELYKTVEEQIVKTFGKPKPKKSAIKKAGEEPNSKVSSNTTNTKSEKLDNSKVSSNTTNTKAENTTNTKAEKLVNTKAEKLVNTNTKQLVDTNTKAEKSSNTKAEKSSDTTNTKSEKLVNSNSKASSDTTNTTNTKAEKLVDTNSKGLSDITSKSEKLVNPEEDEKTGKITNTETKSKTDKALSKTSPDNTNVKHNLETNSSNNSSSIEKQGPIGEISSNSQRLGNEYHTNSLESNKSKTVYTIDGVKITNATKEQEKKINSLQDRSEKAFSSGDYEKIRESEKETEAFVQQFKKTKQYKEAEKLVNTNSKGLSDTTNTNTQQLVNTTNSKTEKLDNSKTEKATNTQQLVNNSKAEEEPKSKGLLGEVLSGAEEELNSKEPGIFSILGSKAEKLVNNSKVEDTTNTTNSKAEKLVNNSKAEKLVNTKAEDTNTQQLVNNSKGLLGEVLSGAEEEPNTQQLVNTNSKTTNTTNSKEPGIFSILGSKAEEELVNNSKAGDTTNTQQLVNTNSKTEKLVNNSKTGDTTNSKGPATDIAKPILKRSDSTSILGDILKYANPITTIGSVTSKATSLIPKNILHKFSGFAEDLINPVKAVSDVGSAISSGVEDILPKSAMKEIDNLKSQGLNDIGTLATSVGISPKLVSKYLGSKSNTNNKSLSVVAPSSSKLVSKEANSKESKDTNSSNNIIISGGSGSAPNTTDKFRIVDKSLDILSQI